jgi:hypothetical protein
MVMARLDARRSRRSTVLVARPCGDSAQGCESRNSEPIRLGLVSFASDSDTVELLPELWAGISPARILLLLELRISKQAHWLVLKVLVKHELVLEVRVVVEHGQVGCSIQPDGPALSQRKNALAGGRRIAQDDDVRVRGAIRVEHRCYFWNQGIERVAEPDDLPWLCRPFIRGQVQRGKGLIEGHRHHNIGIRTIEVIVDDSVATRRPAQAGDGSG